MGASASTQQLGGTGSTQATEPTAAAADPNKPGAGDEEAVHTAVDIGLRNGGFTPSTPPSVQVPPFITVELDFRVSDNRVYELVITGSGPRRALKFTKRGKYTYRLDGLDSDAAASVALGNAKVKITANADPGP